MTDIVNSTSEDANTHQDSIDFNASDFMPASQGSVPNPPEPEIPVPTVKPKPKSWQENKVLAAVILIIGLVIIFLFFYNLFKNAGII